MLETKEIPAVKQCDMRKHIVAKTSIRVIIDGEEVSDFSYNVPQGETADLTLSIDMSVA